MTTPNFLLLEGNSEYVLRSIKSESVDFIITSPPYDNIRNYKGFVFNFEKIAHELFRVLKPNKTMVWVVGDATINGSESLTSFKQAIYFVEQCGFKLHDTMIYHKDNPPPTGGNNRYYQAFEYMFVLSKGTPTLYPITEPRRNKWNDKRTQRTKGFVRNKDGEFDKKTVQLNEIVKKQNVWRYVVSGGASATDKIAYQHPAIFPEKLAEDHILSWTQENDIILDPFCGSGTTGKMALKNNRQFVGIDISREYLNLSKERILLGEQIKQNNLTNT